MSRKLFEGTSDEELTGDSVSKDFLVQCLCACMPSFHPYCDVHDELFINSCMKQMCCCCDPKRMVGLEAFNACILAHSCHCSIQLAMSKWASRVPSLSAGVSKWLQIECILGSFGRTFADVEFIETYKAP